MKRMYIFCRKDLRKNYQAVQAGHALAQFLIQHPSQAKEWNNHTLIYLGVENEQELIREYEYMKSHNLICEIFSEPDIGNQYTAFATYTEPKYMENKKLL